LSGLLGDDHVERDHEPGDLASVEAGGHGSSQVVLTEEDSAIR
jgi:hypothetical protein